jgi:CRISPR-associated endoribonuclease Cas6
MAPDLVSIIIKLSNPQPVSMASDQGRALAAQFLDWVRVVDADWSEALHQPGNQSRPYTVSNLCCLPKAKHGRVFLQKGSQTWFRITSVSPELSLFLIKALLPVLPEEFVLSNSKFNILQVNWEPKDHPWAGWSNYQDLVNHQINGKPTTKIGYQFASATSFHRHGIHFPYATPEMAISSWLRAWNSYAPVTFSDSLVKTIEKSIAVSAYRMQSVPVRYGRATLIGGVGDCTFTILNKDPYWHHVVNVLSDFAFYCGTGVKTALGMGQTRRLGDGYYRGKSRSI